MKILHILYSGLGGHGNVFFSIIRADKEKTFQYEALFNGIEEVKHEYIDSCKGFGIPWNFVSKSPGFDPGYYFKLLKYIRKSDAEIVFIHSSSYIMPALLGSVFSKKRKRIIVRETQANHLKAKMEWFWLGVAMLTANRIVFLTDEYRLETAKKLGWIYKTRKISIIPNGLDLELFQPHKKSIPGKIVIGMQSRLVRIKDHTTLLDAFSILLNKYSDPGISLLLRIAGDGDQKAMLEAKAVSLNLGKSVEFTGVLNEGELLDFLWSLDIYIHASLGETMSNAIMQAMACGKPVVASDVPGINNMIQHNLTGMLAPPRDPVILAGVLFELINNKQEQERLGKSALSFAKKKFSNFTMFENYKKVFTG